jgi:hypothetical protein
MRARSFLILSAITLATTVAAGFAVVRQERPRTAIETGGPVLPALVDRLSEVTTVVIRDAEGTATIRRVDDRWGLGERSDYPVDPDKVRQVVRSLVQLEKAEAKTVRPERYARLAVEDVGAPGSKSKEVTLRNAAGAPIAQVIVGNAAGGVGAEGGTYVRIAGEAQAWLVRGTLSASVEPRDWVDRRLIEIPAADIRQVRIVQPGGATLTAIRESPDGSSFRLGELPAGGKLKRPDAIDALVQAFGDIPLEDLAPRESQAFPAEKTMHVSVTRTDGGVVAFDVVDQDGARWLRFVDGAAPASLPAPGRATAFRVPSWKIAPLERKLSDLVEPRSGS